MSHVWMITAKRERTSIELVRMLQWMIDNDIKKWIIAEEKGIEFDHWQIRLQSRYDFKTMKGYWGNAHIEEASETWEYERKEGNYFTSEDTIERLRRRFGELRPNQKTILDNLSTQSDREIDCIVDRRGCTGKSFLCSYLYEQCQGFYVPPTITTPQGIIQFIASSYKREPIIVVDIPRSTRWTPALYVCMETIKDGLIYDTRYSGKTRNIVGVKLLVLSNTTPNVGKLSEDRWRIYDAEGNRISTKAVKTAQKRVP